MKITASKLRQDIYRILDHVLKTGEPIEIERHGKILKIVSDKAPRAKLSQLKTRKLSDEDLHNFTHIDWTAEWDPSK